VGLSVRKESSAACQSIDLHPTKKWVVVGCEDGRMVVWDYAGNALVASHQFHPKGRTEVRFIARKGWIGIGSANGSVRIMEEDGRRFVHRFDAHGGKVRCMEVHPTKPLLITGAYSDNSIKAWDWDECFKLERTFTGGLFLGAGGVHTDE
jgi:coatomer subunit beta'